MPSPPPAALRRPTPAEIEAARGGFVPDIIGPGLRALICGINPSLYSAAVGHHFARPGNRFWPAIHAAGITPRRLRPDEDGELLALGYGVTNVVERATARADELSPAELVAGGKRLAAKIAAYGPASVAVLGVSAYRAAFDRPRAAMGLQPETLGGAPVWVLPNPSGLNAHYGLDALAAAYREFHAYAGSLAAPAGRAKRGRR
ncbi:MAG TPA: G/U mismatch-specific DNA glycosylase [Polyangiaceae bacterium]|nr:G/U mismatch-specific DNA glycosylase [Polyangiaceae bacterium]